ncbi:MAG TPA: PPK2 family polyphosphate kinase [Nitrososphaeraceae archaeon]|nr:PPK2 family polyphosphate kinase [Nitrososphaeraceae archaeon]
MDQIEKLCVPPLKEGKRDDEISLSKWNPDDTFGKEKEEIEKELDEILPELAELQYKLYAERAKSLLIILQGTDASGKDGVIRNVIRVFNPAGCKVESFKVPTSEELSHDFLWRIHKVIPSKGYIGIFNRSHYEDVIEVRVNNIVSKTIWSRRYRQINDFERHLSENNIKIVKFFLYISKKEQRDRLRDRLLDPSENWKVSADDYERTKKWDLYIEAYEDALKLCSTEWTPWYVVPANKKWFRNWVVAKVIRENLLKLDPNFPTKKIDKSLLDNI